MQIYMPTHDAEDWKEGLADSEKQWRTGYSARTLAYCWEHYKQQGFPPEVAALFAASNEPAFHGLSPLLALPEYKVALEGGNRPSQTDLFVLAKDGADRLVSIAVEGKVNESFGPTLEEWQKEASSGKTLRLTSLQTVLGLSQTLPATIRYQLLHRTASAVLEAQRFNAQSAVMLVHSFSDINRWRADYEAFAQQFGITVQPNCLTFLKNVLGINLYIGWAEGEAQFLNAGAMTGSVSDTAPDALSGSRGTSE